MLIEAENVQGKFLVWECDLVSTTTQKVTTTSGLVSIMTCTSVVLTDWHVSQGFTGRDEDYAMLSVADCQNS